MFYSPAVNPEVRNVFKTANLTEKMYFLHSTFYSVKYKFQGKRYNFSRTPYANPTNSADLI